MVKADYHKISCRDPFFDKKQFAVAAFCIAVLQHELDRIYPGFDSRYCKGICIPTAYAVQNVAYTDDDTGACWW